MSWAAFVSAGVGVWAKKAIASLGLGLVTYVGFSVIDSQINNAVSSMLSGIPADVYQILAMAGFIDALGVWLGAFTAAVGFMSFGRMGVLGGSPA